MYASAWYKARYTAGSLEQGKPGVRAGAPYHHGALLESLAEEGGAFVTSAKKELDQASRPAYSSAPASREGSGGSIPVSDNTDSLCPKTNP